jgi:hypothetical protein
MKSFWKYLLLFLGILIVVFCVALPIFGMMRMGRTFSFMPMSGFTWRGPGMMGHVGLFRMPMFGIGGLLVLGLIVLAIYGLVSLFRKSSRPNATVAQVTNDNAAPATGATTISQAPVEPTPASTPNTSASCSKCGRAVQTDWVVCPYCGEKL